MGMSSTHEVKGIHVDAALQQLPYKRWMAISCSDVQQV